VLSGVVLVVVRGQLLRPMAMLTTQVAALANGEANTEAVNSDDWCEEMQELSNHSARLAQRVERSPGDAA
jgi:nitrate/nitrite-specific signal transduction histidine kinase